MYKPKQVLFIGATGYLGGCTLALLLNHPRVQKKEYAITALIRDAAKAKAFESDNLKTIVGTMSDHDLLFRLCKEFDIVFQSANSDLLPETKVILAGLKTRFEETRNPPVLIHTSGADFLVEGAHGQPPVGDTEPYSDMDSRHINNLPDNLEHRLIDMAIVGADINILQDLDAVDGDVDRSIWDNVKNSMESGYIKSYISAPPTIWGVASTEWTKKGLQNPISQQFPSIISLSLKRGKTMVIGEGLNLWAHIEVHEAAQFYYTLFDAVISDDKPEPPHGYHGFYFLENGEYIQMDVSKEIAKALFKRGMVNSEDVVPLTKQELDQNPSYELYLGTNCRCRAVRSRSLGWEPKLTSKDLVASLETDVEVYLRINPS